MDPTSLPTDNLYKFLAVGGALGAAVIWLGITRKMDRLIERKAELASEQAKLNLAIKQLANGGAAANEGEFNERMSANRELALKEVGLTTAIEAYKHFEKQGEGTAARATAMIVLCLVASVSSFVFWYTRFQWYQDQVTYDAWREQRAKATLAEIELQEKRKKPLTSSAPSAHPSP